MLLDVLLSLVDVKLDVELTPKEVCWARAGFTFKIMDEKWSWISDSMTFLMEWNGYKIGRHFKKKNFSLQIQGKLSSISMTSKI